MVVDRQKVLLGAAGGMVLVLVAWILWPATPAPAPAASPRTRDRAAQVTAPQNGSPVDVKIEALQAAREGPGEAARNPFRFQPRVVPPPPRAAVPVVEPPPVTAAPAPSGPPPIPLKLIGVLERANGVKWAVLTDGKSAPMYGKDGDIIDGRYVIVKIGTESIEMTHTDGRGRQVIRLSGQ
ncbi:MAG TPA: hypothetical protein VEC39_01555 [Vicinamibacterales bacterium]|nr:hypothetical protein [Vicinamibacterales bacterium]